MKAKVEWLPNAEQDLLDVANYYRRIYSGLVASLTAELDNVLERIHTFPESFPLEADGVRRACLSQFPFAIYYHYEDNTAMVAGVLPQRADPRHIAATLLTRLN